MTPTKQTPSECKHYREYARMFVYALCAKCESRLRLCSFYNDKKACPDYQPKEKKNK